MVADHNIASLEALRNRRTIAAKDGQAGGSGCRQGKNGEDLTLKVPCGTLVKDKDSGQVLFDLTKAGETVTLCKGGKGGKGNFSFRTSTNRSPNIATAGIAGEEQEIELELKLIADVGIIGLPNAGKSTLISSLANLKVKIAPYPFTTLQPNVGFLYTDTGARILLADIPGIIEGAHKNRGLGFEFLRHVERTKVLVFVVDSAGSEGRDPKEDFAVMRKELKKYDPELLKRPFLICLNKIDADGALDHVTSFRKSNKEHKDHIYCISALSGEGLDALKEAIVKLVGE